MEWSSAPPMLGTLSTIVKKFAQAALKNRKVISHGATSSRSRTGRNGRVGNLELTNPVEPPTKNSGCQSVPQRWGVQGFDVESFVGALVEHDAVVST